MVSIMVMTITFGKLTECEKMQYCLPTLQTRKSTVTAMAPSFDNQQQN